MQQDGQRQERKLQAPDALRKPDVARPLTREEIEAGVIKQAEADRLLRDAEEAAKKGDLDALLEAKRKAFAAAGVAPAMIDDLLGDVRDTYAETKMVGVPSVQEAKTERYEAPAVERVESEKKLSNTDAIQLDLIGSISEGRERIRSLEADRVDFEESIKTLLKKQESKPLSDEDQKQLEALGADLDRIDARIRKEENGIQNAWADLNEYKQQNPDEADNVAVKERLLHAKMQPRLFTLEFTPEQFSKELQKGEFDTFTNPYFGIMTALALDADKCRILAIENAQKDPALSQLYDTLSNSYKEKRQAFKEYFEKTTGLTVESFKAAGTKERQGISAERGVAKATESMKAKEAGTIAERSAGSQLPEGILPKLYARDDSGRMMFNDRGQPMLAETPEYKKAREKSEAKEAGYPSSKMAEGMEGEMSKMRTLVMELEGKADLESGKTFTAEELQEKQKELDTLRASYKEEGIEFHGMNAEQEKEYMEKGSAKAAALIERIKASQAKKGKKVEAGKLPETFDRIAMPISVSEDSKTKVVGMPEGFSFDEDGDGDNEAAAK